MHSAPSRQSDHTSEYHLRVIHGAISHYIYEINLKKYIKHHKVKEHFTIITTNRIKPLIN